MINTSERFFVEYYKNNWFHISLHFSPGPPPRCSTCSHSRSLIYKYRWISDRNLIEIRYLMINCYDEVGQFSPILMLGLGWVRLKINILVSGVGIWSHCTGLWSCCFLEVVDDGLRNRFDSWEDFSRVCVEIMNDISNTQDRSDLLLELLNSGVLNILVKFIFLKINIPPNGKRRGTLASWSWKLFSGLH